MKGVRYHIPVTTILSKVSDTHLFQSHVPFLPALQNQKHHIRFHQKPSQCCTLNPRLDFYQMLENFLQIKQTHARIVVKFFMM